MSHQNECDVGGDSHEVQLFQLASKSPNAMDANQTDRNETWNRENDDGVRIHLPPMSLAEVGTSQNIENIHGTGSCQSECEQQQQHEPKTSQFTRHVALSCFVFWLCGILFGFIAYLLAAKAEDNASTNKKKARQLGRASLAFSFLGIVAGAIVIAVVLAIIYTRPYKCITDGEYIVGDGCFRNRSVETGDVCRASYDFSYHDGTFCYFNCPRGLYDVKGRCFRQRDYYYPHGEDSCAFDGVNLYDGKYCYHQCPCKAFLAADGNCYNFKSSVEVRDADRCTSKFTKVYFDGTKCYSNCYTDACPHNCSSPAYNRTVAVGRCELRHDDYFYNDGVDCYFLSSPYYNTDAGCFTGRLCGSAVRVVAVNVLSAVSSAMLVCAISSFRFCG